MQTTIVKSLWAAFMGTMVYQTWKHHIARFGMPSWIFNMIHDDKFVVVAKEKPVTWEIGNDYMTTIWPKHEVAKVICKDCIEYDVVVPSNTIIFKNADGSFLANRVLIVGSSYQHDGRQ